MALKHEPAPMVQFLNELLELDPDFVRKCAGYRFLCNERLAEHESVQVRGLDVGFECGIIGVLNGYFGTLSDDPFKGWGPICAIYEGDLLIRFVETGKESG